MKNSITPTIIILMSVISLILCEICKPEHFLVRSKRGFNKYIYPVAGVWYMDSASGKYYFRQGNSIYVQRHDGYYSKWVTSGNGADFVLNDKYKWTWDHLGRLYPLEDNCPNPPKDSQRFGIPIKCLGGQCPDQARFPSGGVWHFANCKYFYETGNYKYELCPNGFYRKWLVSAPNKCFQICPDWWTWDTQNGIWEPVPNSDRKYCNRDEPPCRKQKLEMEPPIVPPKEAFNM